MSSPRSKRRLALFLTFTETDIGTSKPTRGARRPSWNSLSEPMVLDRTASTTAASCAGWMERFNGVHGRLEVVVVLTTAAARVEALQPARQNVPTDSRLVHILRLGKPSEGVTSDGCRAVMSTPIAF